MVRTWSFFQVKGQHSSIARLRTALTSMTWWFLKRWRTGLRARQHETGMVRKGWTAVQLRMGERQPTCPQVGKNSYLTQPWLIGPSTEDPHVFLAAIMLLPTGCWRTSLRREPVPRNAISPRKVVADKIDVSLFQRCSVRGIFSADSDV